MAAIDNSSQGMKRLRASLGQNLEDLKNTMKTSVQLVVEVKPYWQDSQYSTFAGNFNKGITLVDALLKKMGMYDKQLEELQTHLKKYEDIVQVDPFK